MTPTCLEGPLVPIRGICSGGTGFSVGLTGGNNVYHNVHEGKALSAPVSAVGRPSGADVITMAGSQTFRSE